MEARQASPLGSVTSAMLKARREQASRVYSVSNYEEHLRTHPVKGVTINFHWYRSAGEGRVLVIDYDVRGLGRDHVMIHTIPGARIEFIVEWLDGLVGDEALLIPRVAVRGGQILPQYSEVPLDAILAAGLELKSIVVEGLPPIIASDTFNHSRDIDLLKRFFRGNTFVSKDELKAALKAVHDRIDQSD